MDLVDIMEAHFDGETYEPEKDQARLTGQLLRVYEAMSDGQWHTLSWLANEASGSEAGVSARLRDLRKPRFGSFTVERRRGDNGLWFYRLQNPSNGKADVSPSHEETVN